MFIMNSFACAILELVFPNNCLYMLVSFPGKLNIVISPGALPERSGSSLPRGAPAERGSPLHTHTDERREM